MPQDRQKVIDTLRGVRLFDGLDNVQLDRVAASTRAIFLKEGETLKQDGKSDPFFLVISGKVNYSRSARGNGAASYVLKHGDFCGADVLFRGKPKAYSLTAVKPALVFSIRVELLRLLVNTIPVLTKNIKKQLDWYNLVRSKPFSWLGDEETVKLICRKHPAYLIVSEMIPLTVAWGGLLLILLATLITTTSFRLAVGWSGAGVVGLGVLWGLWRFWDWGNDYYILTEERIVWLERTIGLYDSRQEAPLVAIKSGETKSSQIGRILGYGDVITQTFVGQIFFRHIRNPAEIKAMIDLERKQATERQMSSDIQAVEGKIRQKIEPIQGATVSASTRATVPMQVTHEPVNVETKVVPVRLSFWQSIIARFQTRWESGGVITYRKHLYVLFRMTWLPAFFVLALLGLTGLAYHWRKIGVVKISSPEVILVLGIFMAGMAFLWWLYNFLDWSNDIYRVTADKIIDSERKPLGDEITKSAPLENIIGLDYERLGFLGVVLNFGNVVINVGTENKFIFYGIHNPARAQRDIFNYMFEQRRRKLRTDTQQEQDRVSSYIAAYHRQAEDLRKTQKPPQI